MTDVPGDEPLPFHVRQGDVLVIHTDAIPVDATPIARDGGRVILAYGEVTGHAHAIRSRAAVLMERGLDRYLRASDPVALEHEEHATIELPAGLFRVVVQREYLPSPVAANSWRPVVD